MIDPNAFISRERKELSDEEWNEVQKFQYVKCDTMKDISDPKYDWQMCVRKSARDYKYSRIMVSFSQRVYRGTTMGEFYGTSEVD